MATPVTQSNENPKSSNRVRMLLENYITAKLEGQKEGYDIKTVEEDNYEHFYILFRPLAGIYKDQFHILEMKTEYGHGADKTTFPYNAPYIKFNTLVYHTNISTNGAICLDILKDKNKWAPTYDFSSIIRNILLLFEEPNNASPFNGEASRAYVDCEKRYKESKDKRMTFKEEEALKVRCFATFKAFADKHAKTNDKELTNTYSKWFPQLVGKQPDAEELEELKTMLESMKLKKKKKVVEEVKKDDNTPSDNNQTNPLEEKKEPTKKTFDVSKFAKYQKKK
jgi:ubiquitin-protein ligase